jgi:hypothetical protein
MATAGRLSQPVPVYRYVMLGGDVYEQPEKFQDRFRSP